MKTYLFQSLRLTVVIIAICGALYPIAIAAIAKIAPSGGNGEAVYLHMEKVGYKLIGQKFTDDKLFWGRPSAVDYNAAGSAGSNKGPSNEEYISVVKARIDTFLVHNPDVKLSDIPSELVTASGSGLDPDISVKSAKIQVPRIAKTRQMSEEEINKIIEETKETPILGPEKVNVLKLNIALNKSE